MTGFLYNIFIRNQWISFFFNKYFAYDFMNSQLKTLAWIALTCVSFESCYFTQNMWKGRKVKK